MIQQFDTKSDGSIEVDFDKKEAYFKRDDLLADMALDGHGYWTFYHPMWLRQFRIFTGSKPFTLEVQEWRAA